VTIGVLTTCCYACVVCALLRDGLMTGFIFTTDDKPGCRCTTCSLPWAAEQIFRSDLISRNCGNKMSISYNCMKQPVYAAGGY
jgi:hypothetical protein